MIHPLWLDLRAPGTQRVRFDHFSSMESLLMRRSDGLVCVRTRGLTLILTAIGLFVLPPATLAQESARTSASKTIDGNAVLTGRGVHAGRQPLSPESRNRRAGRDKEGEEKLRQLEGQGGAPGRRSRMIRNVSRIWIRS